MDALFAEARSLVSRCKEDRQRKEGEESAAHQAAVRAAQDVLLEGVLANLHASVVEAAAAGKREVDVLAFDGNSTFNGEFCYLYLLKGPRVPEDGVQPLLPRLRQRLAPFRVRHVWKQGTVQNKVVVAWD